MKRDVYRTRDGSLYFEFGFVENNGTYDVYIVKQPDKIEFVTPIRTLQEARQIAAIWAEEMAKSARTAENFRLSNQSNAN
jgi:hypothetical protein